LGSFGQNAVLSTGTRRVRLAKTLGGLHRWVRLAKLPGARSRRNLKNHFSARRICTAAITLFEGPSELANLALLRATELPILCASYAQVPERSPNGSLLAALCCGTAIWERCEVKRARGGHRQVRRE
jgi:hypothetical protein